MLTEYERLLVNEIVAEVETLRAALGPAEPPALQRIKALAAILTAGPTELEKKE